MKRILNFMTRLTYLKDGRRRSAISAALICALVFGSVQARAQDAVPQLRTNESDIAAAMRSSNLAIDDPVAVFAFVLSRLPQSVQVYPTENYYYFHFIHDGVRYGGNIRLAASNRDKGEVNFAYGETPSDWNDDPPGRHAAFGAAQGDGGAIAPPTTASR
jgi:hypothetical protein